VNGEAGYAQFRREFPNEVRSLLSDSWRVYGGHRSLVEAAVLRSRGEETEKKRRNEAEARKKPSSIEGETIGGTTHL